jgi:hypothetical protein
MKKEKRLLPGDFQRKIKYEALDNTEKEVEPLTGRFFDFPEDFKGFQFKDRDFLVFYFDREEDYQVVLKHFQILKKAAISHPELDSTKLVDMVIKERGNS